MQAHCRMPDDFVVARNPEPDSSLPYLVMTKVRGGRQVIFWQTARTNKQARPNVAVPSARAAGFRELEIVVDSHERYPFAFRDQQVPTRRAGLPAGDYGIVLDDSLLASVERKRLADLASSLTTGKLKYQLADLAAVPRAAVVVADRYSRVFKPTHVRPAVVAEGLAECQVAWSSVPILFLETKALAQEWTYRFLAAARAAAEQEYGGEVVVRDLRAAPPLAPREPTPAEVRAWAVEQGLEVSDRGRVRAGGRPATREYRHGSVVPQRARFKSAARSATRPSGASAARLFGLSGRPRSWALESARLSKYGATSGQTACTSRQKMPAPVGPIRWKEVTAFSRAATSSWDAGRIRRRSPWWSSRTCADSCSSAVAVLSSYRR